MKNEAHFFTLDGEIKINRSEWIHSTFWNLFVLRLDHKTAPLEPLKF